MYIMCVCLFSALNRRVGALQISIIIIISETQRVWQDMKMCSTSHRSVQNVGKILSKSSGSATG